MTNSVRYDGVDVLLMDPAYTRTIGWCEDTELECVDLVAETLVDGMYHVFGGRLEDFDEDDERFQPDRVLQVLGLDTGRIGVYNYAKALLEMPELKASVEGKPYFGAVIPHFSGTVFSLTDEDGEVHVIGRSDDGLHDFFTIEHL